MTSKLFEPTMLLYCAQNLRDVNMLDLNRALQSNTENVESLNSTLSPVRNNSELCNRRNTAETSMFKNLLSPILGLNSTRFDYFDDLQYHPFSPAKDNTQFDNDTEPDLACSELAHSMSNISFNCPNNDEIEFTQCEDMGNTMSTASTDKPSIDSYSTSTLPLTIRQRSCRTRSIHSGLQRWMIDKNHRSSIIRCNQATRQLTIGTIIQACRAVLYCSGFGLLKLCQTIFNIDDISDDAVGVRTGGQLHNNKNLCKQARGGGGGNTAQPRAASVNQHHIFNKRSNSHTSNHPRRLLQRPLLIVTVKAQLDSWATAVRAVPVPQLRLLLYTDTLANRRKLGVYGISHHDVIITTFDVLKSKEVRIPENVEDSDDEDRGSEDVINRGYLNDSSESNLDEFNQPILKPNAAQLTNGNNNRMTASVSSPLSQSLSGSRSWLTHRSARNKLRHEVSNLHLFKWEWLVLDHHDSSCMRKGTARGDALLSLTGARRLAVVTNTQDTAEQATCPESETVSHYQSQHQQLKRAHSAPLPGTGTVTAADQPSHCMSERYQRNVLKDKQVLVALSSLGGNSTGSVSSSLVFDVNMPFTR